MEAVLRNVVDPFMFVMLSERLPPQLLDMKITVFFGRVHVEPPSIAMRVVRTEVYRVSEYWARWRGAGHVRLVERSSIVPYLRSDGAIVVEYPDGLVAVVIFDKEIQEYLEETARRFLG